MASNKAPEVQTQPCTGDAVEQRPIDENTPLLSRDNGSGSGNAHPARRRRSHCIFALCGSVLLIDAIIAILALFGGMLPLPLVLLFIITHLLCLDTHGESISSRLRLSRLILPPRYSL